MMYPWVEKWRVAALAQLELLASPEILLGVQPPELEKAIEQARRAGVEKDLVQAAGDKLTQAKGAQERYMLYRRSARPIERDAPHVLLHASYSTARGFKPTPRDPRSATARKAKAGYSSSRPRRTEGAAAGARI